MAISIPKDNKLALFGFVLLVVVLAIGGGPLILGFAIVLTLGFCLMWAGIPIALIVIIILLFVFIIIPLYSELKTTIKNSFKKFKRKQAKLEGKLLTIKVDK